eukprot:4600630-Alexandrium_andersonii.AAC.1
MAGRAGRETWRGMGVHEVSRAVQGEHEQWTMPMPDMVSQLPPATPNTYTDGSVSEPSRPE